MTSSDDTGLRNDSSLAVDRTVETVDASQWSPHQLRERLMQVDVPKDSDQSWQKITVVNFNAAMPLLPMHNVGVSIRLESALPNDSLFYFVRGEIDARQNAGDRIACGMSGGVVRIHRSIGHAAAGCMSGGTLAVYGGGGDRIGAAMTGGGIFVRGHVGDECGYAAIGGTMVFGGGTGLRLGHRSRGATFFVRGEVASLGRDIVEAPMRKQPQLRLGMLLMNASIQGKPTDFKRYVHADELAAEKASRGEVTASWR